MKELLSNVAENEVLITMFSDLAAIVVAVGGNLPELVGENLPVSCP